jgi:hypothetical protein
LHVDDAIGCGT